MENIKCKNYLMYILLLSMYMPDFLRLLHILRKLKMCVFVNVLVKKQASMAI